MNALDTALSSLAEASTALEHVSRPTLKDIERSRDRAKDAHEILDASAKLLKRGIYTVAEEPPAETPLFNTQGEPAPGAEVEPPVGLPPFPTDVPTIGMNVLRVSFEHKILEAESAWKEQGKKFKAFKSVRKAWEARFEQDPDATAKALQLALDTPNHDLLPPQQVETQAPVKYPTPDFENTTGIDLAELFATGPMAELAGEIDKTFTSEGDAEACKVSWENSFEQAPRATWFAALAVLANPEAAVDLPNPLPDVPAALEAAS